MSNPTDAQLHVATPLDNFSLAYMQAATDFHAREVAPIVGVNKNTDKYFIFDKADWFRDEAQLRAPGGEFHEVGYRLSTDTYFTDQYDAAFPIPDEDRKNADAAVDLEKDGVEFIIQKLLLKQEILMAAKAFATGWTATDQTGVASDSPSTNQFAQFNRGGSSPISVIRGRITAVKDLCGLRPNVVAMGEQVWDVLADHADILDRIKHTSSDAPTPELLARVLGVSKVVVCGAVKNTALEAAAASISRIAGKSMFVGYINPNPGLRQLSALKTFCFAPGSEGYNAATGYRLRVKRDDGRDRDLVVGDIQLDVKVTAVDAGAYCASCIA